MSDCSESRPPSVWASLCDHFVSTALFDNLPQWVPNLQRHEVDAGHWLPLSHPEVLSSMVREFVLAGEAEAANRATAQPDRIEHLYGVSA